MAMSEKMMRRISIAALVLAAPAFVLLTFDALVRGGGSNDRPSLVQDVSRAPGEIAASLRGPRPAFFAPGERIASASHEPATPAVAPSEPATPAFTLPILVYHNVRDKLAAVPPALRPYDITPAEFDAEMSYLEDHGYVSVSFGDLDAALAGTKPLPRKSVLITLDDGRDTQLQNAYPSLLRHHLTATFFVFTNAIGRPGYLTWNQLRDMHDHGMDVQSHTVFHPFLTKLDDASLKKEMDYSKAAIEKNLGLTSTVLAYPFGLHDARVDAAVAAAGYLDARTLTHSTAIYTDRRLDLPGYITTGDIRLFPRILNGDK